ncbi:MAG: hypothetical protein M1376_20095 [Planctomycetes bacterium]|nr:hypothetical protein [Planctomycetota bacterium]
MSQKPYQREQGDFELRILKDGRLVMIAPDETLMEIAQAIEMQADSEQQQHLEIHDAETTAPGRE